MGGGFFERMVKSVKRCLKKTLGNSSLTYDELLTVLVEIEMVLNSRPLSFVSSNDLQEPLTPSHLLTGYRLLSLPPCNYPEDFDYNSTIQEVSFTKRMAYFDNLLNHFWKRWQSEYLIELRECHRYQLSKYGSNPIPPSVGDIVLIHDQDRPRGQWRLAIVQEILSGSDGHVRGAVVRTSSKLGHSSLLRRSVRHLYPLEVALESHKSDDSDPEVADEPEPLHRSRRAAAIAATDNIKCIQGFERDSS